MDPIVLLVMNVVVIAYMWLVHGGLDRVVNDGWLIAIGQVAGLYGAATAANRHESHPPRAGRHLPISAHMGG
jgi:hypothetical protein